MSTIPTVNVTARFFDPEGRPLRGAVVSMRLTTTERYQGYVVPAEVRAVTDGTGAAVLAVWPNELGTESSEYLVTVTFPENCTVQGGTPGRVSPRSIRAYAVVPDADCLLHDIMELPPYDQRGAGQIIASEVAAYADAASHHADEARSAVHEARAVETRLLAAAGAAEGAKDAAAQAETSAEAAAERAAKTVDGFETEVCAERDKLVKAVNDAANQRKAEALACISQAESVALDAMERRTGEALTETTQAISDARTEAVGAVNNAGQRALTEIGAAGAEEVRKLRDEAALYDEDFQILTERALAAAKKAGCSAASAANSATKACDCATRAETSARETDEARDAGLEAARQAQAAAGRADADALRAESARHSAATDAATARDAADLARKSAQGAHEDAGIALSSRGAAETARSEAQVARDEAVKAAADVDRALMDKAVEALTPQIVTEAVDLATRTATDAADAAATAATDATRQANLAKTRADRAESARDKAEAARAVAEDLAGKLYQNYRFETHAMTLSAQIIRLADRVTRVELDHVHGGGSVAAAIPPGGYELSPGVTVAPLTLSHNPEGGSVAGAALTAIMQPYNSPQGA